MRSTTRTYAELAQFDTLLDRFRYLSLRGTVGEATFGFERWMNQEFYRSSEWRRIRHHVIARDEGNDLGIEGYPIHDRVIVHHMNPMNPYEIEHGDEAILNPDFLISTTLRTHNAIHYGDERQLPRPFVPRRPGDTIPWRTR